MSRRANHKAAKRAKRRAEKVLTGNGTLDRVARAKVALASPFFVEHLRQAIARAERIAPITTYDRVRALAMACLRSTYPSLDLRGIQLSFAWDPATKKLDIYCRPAVGAGDPGPATVEARAQIGPV